MTTQGGVSIPPELLGSMNRYAVYRCYSDGGELLYVGTSGHLGKRLASHAEKAWFVQVRGITLEWYATEVEALNAERRAIHVEHPKYNVQHRTARRIKPRAVAHKAPRDDRPSGRNMSADQVAAYIWEHREGDEVPSVNAIMRMVAVSRPKAKDAYDILKLTHWAGAEVIGHG